MKVNGKLFQKIGFEKEEPKTENNIEDKEEIKIEDVIDEKGDIIKWMVESKYLTL